MSHPVGYAFGEYVLDTTQKRLLKREGSPVELTPRLFAALRLLVERSGELVGKQALLDHVWPGLVVGENSLSQAIAGLRRILGDDAQGSRFIQTVPRKGFRFVAPVTPFVFEPAQGPAAPVVPASTVAVMGPTGRAVERPAGRRRLLAGLAAMGIATAGLGTWGWRKQRSATLTTPSKLAVLPFKQVGSQDRDKLLDVGMADSLIARLSVLPGIAVLAPGSVNRFGGSDRDPMQAARELDAHWVVDGSVQRVGDRLRVVARLLRAEDGTTTWTNVLDRDAAGMFELQDELANEVALALTGTLPPPGRRDRIELGGTRSVEAYQLYLAAAWRAQGGRAADIERGIALAEQALAIDPGYAGAWALLGWIHRRRLWNADAPPADVFARSDAAVQRAIALVPSLALARAGVGFSRFWYSYDWVGAEQEFRRALATNPSEANAQWGLAFLLLTQGRIEDGFAHMALTRELDPLSPIWHTLEASFLTAAGRYPEARRQVQVALDISPNQWLSHAALGRLLLAEGKQDAGFAELRRAVALGSDTVRPKAHLAVQMAVHGDPAAAKAILAEIRERATHGYVPPTSLAMIHAALGQSQAALDELDRAYELRDTRLVELKGDPCWQSIRDHPRFVALLRLLKLDEAGTGLASV
jgi:DNA-binding winged helix-turn-helix (wHTH) protein/TolB-like protein